ncbi:MAG: hypothetical protein DRI79_12465 [Chloroflexi bacterium]|nr:MAG: hypothetical protein DRI80_00380 [Chloroflexota bacterium]RLC84721.1 MAG: hypothetical protein DRI79_12465 [Chloroflexota bacterium]HEY66750.1 hypothetical protein [Thermoflexia bacterium]
MPLFYPSFDALRLADRLLDEIGKRTPGYEGRVGAAWYWRLPAGILVTARLDNTVTEERWDVLRAQASTPRAGVFSRADFPFAAYATSATSPPFIHDLQGVAEWSNRLYFQMGRLIEDAVHWLGLLHAVAISPQVSPPASFPALSRLERRLVRYALDELEGYFNIKALHRAFRDEISRSRLSALAQTWEASELLTQRPRRVTYALRVLAEEE